MTVKDNKNIADVQFVVIWSGILEHIGPDYTTLTQKQKSNDKKLKLTWQRWVPILQYLWVLYLRKSRVK